MLALKIDRNMQYNLVSFPLKFSYMDFMNHIIFFKLYLQIIYLSNS